MEEEFREGSNLLLTTPGASIVQALLLYGCEVAARLSHQARLGKNFLWRLVNEEVVDLQLINIESSDKYICCDMHVVTRLKQNLPGPSSANIAR